MPRFINQKYGATNLAVPYSLRIPGALSVPTPGETSLSVPTPPGYLEPCQSPLLEKPVFFQSPHLKDAWSLVSPLFGQNCITYIHQQKETVYYI